MSHDSSEFGIRLSILEKQNRALRRAVLALGLSLAGLVLVAATSRSLPQDASFRHLEAEDVVVRNASGTQLKIWSHVGVPDGVALDLTTRDSSGNHIVGRFAAFGRSGQLSVSRSEQSQSIALMPDDVAQLMQPGGGRGPGIIIRGEAPFVSLADTKNYTAILGATNLSLPGGTEINTTAATLHLFNDKGKIAWSAP